MSKLLINEAPLLVLPSLAVRIGLNEAIILQQLHYWLDPRHNSNFIDNHFWVYNTYTQWQEQLPFLSERTIRRAFDALGKLDLILVRNFNSNPIDKTNWYTINYDQLEKYDLQSTGQNGQSIRPKWPGEQSKVADTKGQNGRIYTKETKTTTKTTTNTLYKQPRGEGAKMLSEESKEREMILIWNETTLNEVSLQTSTKRKNDLRYALTNYFNSSLEDWRIFCERIANNDFLMGRVDKGNFKAFLDWAIKPDSIEKIREGSYEKGKGAQPQAATETLDAESGNVLEAAIISQIEKEPNIEWKAVKELLLKHYGAPTFKSWFSKLSLTSVNEGLVQISAPTRFVKEYVSTHYLHILQKLWRAHLGSDITLELIVAVS